MRRKRKLLVPLLEELGDRDAELYSRPLSLRQAVGPNGAPVYVHVPFTTSDLLHWKQAVASYQNNPEGLYNTIKPVMMTHDPNWRDIQAFMQYLFTHEQRRTVLEKAREGLSQKHGGVPTADIDLPREDPKPDPKTDEGLQGIKEYQELILYGILKGVEKPKN